MNYQIFRPTSTYWLKTWTPICLSWLFILITGIQRNMGTPTLNRAISFSLFITVVFVWLIVFTARQQIAISSHGIFVQTLQKSFYLPWSQITAVNFYAVGSESKPRLFLSTAKHNYKFNIDLYAQDDLEDAITNKVGEDMVGSGAYQATEKYKRAKEEYELTIKRIGETKKFIGGSVNNLIYTYALVLGILFFGVALLFLLLGNWIVTILFLIISGYSFLRPLSLSGGFYMNRNHIVCRHPWPWNTHMISWREIDMIDISFRCVVFTGNNKQLVAPGLLFWKGSAAKRLNYILSYQIEKHDIYLRPFDYFSIKTNKNVRTDRFD